jgi:hypothetical protein
MGAWVRVASQMLKKAKRASYLVYRIAMDVVGAGAGGLTGI